ncbi:thiol-disulfide isomerase/thioredoxin [Desulfobaculum xiamenense]|uniref:Thiol-disulfide isomerase/thioredoxin n=1 Tax=Desulfobaculum xiamenense TaxID=995050 RepID=A0A846QF27_9BACT|nr:TlpA disulfide reductase family protein [Desulfobaculum xiamenense]NJB66938.1 thiol-disulfide isomerase/thioredoxin [Desulfobaculum xiamenense]
MRKGFVKRLAGGVVLSAALLGFSAPFVVGQAHADAAVAALPGNERDTVAAMDIIRAVGSARGRVVVVNFWATWCPPCRAEIPELRQLRESYSDADLLLLGVSLDDDEKAYAEFLGRTEFNYPVRRADDSVTSFFRIEGIPRIMVYDAAGKLAVNHEGMVTADELSPVVDKLLNRKE